MSQVRFLPGAQKNNADEIEAKAEEVEEYLTEVEHQEAVESAAFVEAVEAAEADAQGVTPEQS